MRRHISLPSSRARPQRLLRLVCGALLLSCPFGVSPVRAQTDAMHADTRVLSGGASGDASTADSLNLALEDADVRELVRWASPYLDKPVVLHPQVQGKVTVYGGAPLGRGDVRRVLLSVLQVHGFTVIETAESIKILPDALAKENTPRFLGESAQQADEEIVVHVLKLTNIPAQDVVELLRPMVPQSALLTHYPGSNLLLLADRASNIEHLLKLVQRVDQAGEIDIDTLALQFADARAVAAVVNTLLPRSEAGAGGGQAFAIAVDERSNSVLMSGDPVLREQLGGLIRGLDRPAGKGDSTQVIFLDYASATELLPVLKSVAANALKDAADQTFRKDAAVNLEVSEASNAIVVTAPAPVLAALRSVVAELDTRRPQVLVEAVIIEVGRELFRDIGVEWRNTLPEDGVFAGSAALPGGVSTPAAPRLGEGFTLGFYGSGELRALLRALEGSSRANVLSTPTIVAMNNETAEILVGENVPFITGASTGAASSTGNPFQTIERKDIGVTLKVRPRINRDGSIDMSIEQTVESISPSAADAADIVTSKRRISTRVLIGDDEVLVLGGLMRDEFTQAGKGVPLLSRIPVLGRLFRSSSGKTLKKNLMVFIHPRILGSRVAAEALSRPRYEHLQQEQRRFNAAGDELRARGALPEAPALPPVP